MLRVSALLLGTLLGLGPVVARAADDFTAEQATRDARILRRALTELHPALTKYRTREEIDAAFARWDARAAAARTRGEMFLAASELTAAIRCSHTWPQTRYNQSEAVLQLLNGGADKLSCLFAIAEDRWLITATAVDTLRDGDEILAVDDVPVAEITRSLLPYVRADGAANHKRIEQIDQRWGHPGMFDFLWPLLRPAVDGTRRLTVHRDGRTSAVTVGGLSLDQRLQALRARGYQAPDNTWRLRIDGATAVITLPTFAFFNGQFDGKAWLRDAFDQIKRAPVTRLVLDLRANEGGNDGLGEEVLSYLLKAPFVVEPGSPLGAYERVPYVLARFLETWDYDFFDRTGRVEKLGERTYLLKYRMEQERRIVPQAAAFSGRVVALVGPRNSSATSVLARRLQQTRAAVLVGQPTGGNRRGLNGGEIAWIRLPGSGVAVDIPLVAQNPAQDEPDASTVPDVEVARTFADLQSGVDREMAAALRALASP